MKRKSSSRHRTSLGCCRRKGRSRCQCQQRRRCASQSTRRAGRGQAGVNRAGTPVSFVSASTFIVTLQNIFSNQQLSPSHLSGRFYLTPPLCCQDGSEFWLRMQTKDTGRKRTQRTQRHHIFSLCSLRSFAAKISVFRTVRPTTGGKDAAVTCRQGCLRYIGACLRHVKDACVTWAAARDVQLAQLESCGYRKRLQPQEDFFAVEEVTEPNAQAQADQSNDQVAETGGHSVVEKSLYVATGEAESKPVEIDNVIGQINRDGVRPD